MARRFQTTTQSGHLILVIDDDAQVREATQQLLEGEGHRVVLAESGQQGVELHASVRPHLVLVDFFMPGMTGEEVVRRIRETDPLVQIILATGYSGEKPALLMMQQLDIQGYHDKSEGAERLLLWVNSALKAFRLVRSMEKHRIGLQYILDITPDLHRLQPMEELLQGLLWQVEGLMGAENSFLATYSSEQMIRAALPEPEGFVALVEPQSTSSALEVRFGTGRYRAGLSATALPEPERSAVEEAVSTGIVQFRAETSVLPLRLGEKTLGAIYLDRRPGLERDRNLLEIFASQAAAAIQNTLLYGQNEMLFDLATRDGTTGVYLRGFAMQQLQQNLKRAHRTGNPMSVLMLDMDKFKPINDQHGHLAGDRALKAVGDLLRLSVRETDMVGRYGGDEFLVILPDTPEAGARVLAERLLTAARTLSVDVEGVSVPVRFSIGHATLVRLHQTPDYALLRHEAIERVSQQLIDTADQGLYAAKGSGHAGDGGVIRWDDLRVSAA